MVFICLGTHDMAFNRLLSMVEECIDSGVINEEVIAQCGCTKYSGEKIKCFDYCPSDEMDNYIKNASYIITHGGTGTIVSALKMGKKVIAVNRLAKYKEHTTDHQIQIISEFVDTGYILGCYEGDLLADKIKELSTFTPNVFVSNTENVLAYLREYIDSVLNK
ncbi:MAG: beta(1,3)galactosyltransferase EpsH [Erysipelotrichales bacterium]|nr:beta(1,3)galactosyltransferase EpsH [Erysipelotrichales bacterium]